MSETILCGRCRARKAQVCVQCLCEIHDGCSWAELLAVLKKARHALARIQALGVVPWEHTDIAWGLHEIDSVLAKTKGGAA